MYFLPVSIALFLLFLILIPVLFALAPAMAFSKLGLSPICGYIFFLLCLFGSVVNIPIHKREISTEIPINEIEILARRFLGIRLPIGRFQVIAINAGGALLPSLLGLYLLLRTPLDLALAATAVTTAVSFFLSKPVRGIGVVLPAFVPPIVAAITAFLLSKEYAPQIAYISGVFGTLIGADLLRLRQIQKLGSAFISIGGAGVFDGIYLVGLVSVLLA